MANLMVITRNDQPAREERHPQNWVLYKGEETIDIHVEHDSQNRPRVLVKGVA